MQLKNLKNLDYDLNRGLEYNRKHGGVSNKLKRRMKRPESGMWRQNAHFNEDRELYEKGWEKINWEK